MRCLLTWGPVNVPLHLAIVADTTKRGRKLRGRGFCGFLSLKSYIDSSTFQFQSSETQSNGNRFRDGTSKAFQVILVLSFAIQDANRRGHF